MTNIFKPKVHVELEKLSEALKIPNEVFEIAKSVALKMGYHYSGKLAEANAIASLYYACRVKMIPITLEEIVEEMFKLKQPKKSYIEISKYVSWMMRETRRQFIEITGVFGNVPRMPPSLFIPKIAEKIGLPNEIVEKAIEISGKAYEIGLDLARNPISIVAASIYIACILCGEPRRQKDIAEASKINEVTLRNRYKELNAKLDFGIEV
ncbi:MAG: hypothetical protein MRT15_04110 [archaeon YNP-LCB-003-016]|uniref:hypothetical protein n=1 Tax=Candidatus Culexarchaeum yellowstonense TaxID=2928963 RepID=UPI0026F1F8BC|nr:hypothetical protein [Candidatus Culexarchaeum yellowstonense]MCR6691552.1 hypothetical protein [Candidatus Culexarchaeum yellowstonense]